MGQPVLHFTGGASGTRPSNEVWMRANLDHTLEFAEAFEAVGDSRSAALMRVIHRDEIEHVRFGWEWLKQLKPPELSDWEAWQQHLHWPLRPRKARGDVFQKQARRETGMSEEFITRLESLSEATEE
jgi:uncharacterized ferritin-like protein (DUF455 family)